MISAPEVHGPRDVVALRQWLLDQWRPGRAFERVFTLHEQVPRDVDGTSFVRATPEWQRDVLTAASLWWVGADMCALTEATFASLPHETVLTRELIPDPSGFVVFETPMMGLDALGARKPVRVDAIAWGPTLLPPVPVVNGAKTWGRFDPRNGRPAISFAAYQRCKMGDGLTSEQMREPDVQLAMMVSAAMVERAGVRQSLIGDVWAPLGRTDWMLDSRVDDEPWLSMGDAGDDEAAHASMIEDRQWMATIWLLSQQRNVTTSERVVPARPERRAAQRAKVSHDVRVVYLRNHAPASEHGEGVERGRYSHRWFVRPHWRMQPCGPGRSQRRPTLVAGHVRGPEGAPFKAKQTVKAWVK